MTEADFTALFVTLRLAGITTILLLLLGTPIAWWLSRTGSVAKPAVEALVALPLILPPTVLGFYLLIALSPTGFPGSLIYSLTGRTLAFSFSGLVIGSILYSMPFVVQPLQNAFESVGREPLEAAATLGASPLDAFRFVVVPLVKSSFLTAAILGFAHTVGEFGVVLMIGGSIPGETQVLSIAIYDHVESLEYARAHTIAGLLFIISFTLLLFTYTRKRSYRLMRL